MVVHAVPVCSSTVVVAVDVGKTEFAFSVTDVAHTFAQASHGVPDDRVVADAGDR